jgi:hypothetical protein
MTSIAELFVSPGGAWSRIGSIASRSSVQRHGKTFLFHVRDSKLHLGLSLVGPYEVTPRSTSQPISGMALLVQNGAFTFERHWGLRYVGSFLISLSRILWMQAKHGAKKTRFTEADRLRGHHTVITEGTRHDEMAINPFGAPMSQVRGLMPYIHELRGFPRRTGSQRKS